MDDLEDLMYSQEASITRYVYYQGLNEINIFVEDKNKEYEYETIFKRLLDEKYNISAIFTSGGKENMEKIFKELGEETEGVKNFFIVDGDFDRYIYANQMISHPCYIYLKTYNIESYFLDEDACIQFAKGSLKCLDNIVKKKIAFKKWKEDIVGQASKLFLCYCFVKKYYPQQKTVDRSPYLFIDDKTGLEREGAYQKYFETVLELDKEAEQKISDIAIVYESINGKDYFNLICGKFLFDSLYCHIRSVIGRKFEKDAFRWHLINNFDISKLNYVKDAILKQSQVENKIVD